MTDTEKIQLIREQLHKIQDMTTYRLQAYAQSVSLSTWDDDIKKWLMRAIDVRAEELISNIHTASAMVVQEELKEIS